MNEQQMKQKLKSIDKKLDKSRIEWEKLIDQKEPIEKSLFKTKYGKYIGRHYKFQDSYGDSTETWWVYIKIIGVGEDILHNIEFSDSPMGKQIRMWTVYPSALHDRYQRIYKKEYEEAKQEFMLTLSLLEIDQ